MHTRNGWRIMQKQKKESMVQKLKTRDRNFSSNKDDEVVFLEKQTGPQCLWFSPFIIENL